MTTDAATAAPAPESARPFDVFELCVALLLGFAAIGAALAGMQSGQWGGKQLDAFAEANALTTKAAKSYSEAVSAINSDYAVVGQAKRLILEGVDAEDQFAQERHYKLASYYLTRQLNAPAYLALGLPQDLFPEETPEGQEAPPVTEEMIETEMGVLLPEEELLGVLEVELDDDDTYQNVMFEEGTKLFADADKKFAEGRMANENGDKFDLAGVFFTVALFFAGLSLVFKSRGRWGFLYGGAAVFGLTAIYLMVLPWA